MVDGVAEDEESMEGDEENYMIRASRQTEIEENKVSASTYSRMRSYCLRSLNLFVLYSTMKIHKRRQLTISWGPLRARARIVGVQSQIKINLVSKEITRARLALRHAHPDSCLQVESVTQEALLLSKQAYASRNATRCSVVDVAVDLQVSQLKSIQS